MKDKLSSSVSSVYSVRNISSHGIHGKRGNFRILFSHKLHFLHSPCISIDITLAAISSICLLIKIYDHEKSHFFRDVGDYGAGNKL